MYNKMKATLNYVPHDNDIYTSSYGLSVREDLYLTMYFLSALISNFIMTLREASVRVLDDIV